MQLDGSFAYSFMLGVLAAVNPCGFALLPNYLLYFLGTEPGATSPNAPVRVAIRVGMSVSSGFLTVFVVVGVISRLFTQWIEQNAKSAALVIGLAIIATGIRMLGGWKPRLLSPRGVSSLERTWPSMFLYGVVYAVASIGCTIGFLTTAVFGSFSVHGVVSGVVSVILYGLGMSLLVTALTVTLSVARQGLLASLRRVLPFVNTLSAVFMIATGAYLSWYWYVAITERSSLGPVGSRIESMQSRLATALQDIGSRPLFVILVSVIAVAVITTRLRRTGSSQQ
ncbi:MAG: cytochrome c biogenesis CcdA family protein [Actinomycetota bacterium]